MAEAHQANVFARFIRPDIRFKSLTLTALNCIYLRFEQKLKRIKNKFYNGLYPTQPDSWLKIATVVFSSPLFGLDLSFGLVHQFEVCIHRFSQIHSPKSQTLASLLYSLLLWMSGVLFKKSLLLFLYSYMDWVYETHSGFSWKTKFWSILVKLFKGGHPRLYSCQATLPKLPLPPVSATLCRYLLSMEPLLSKEELRHTKQLAAEFQAKEAVKLQRYLQFRRWFASNYVSDWWEEYVYLHGRSPLIVNSNIYGLDALIRHPTNIQAARAAQLVSATVNYMLQLINETLEPVMLNNMVPLCMMQYERTFATTRIPGIQSDKSVHLSTVPHHIVVLHRGRYFKMRLFHIDRWLDERELERALQSIIDDPTDPVAGEDIMAALTAGDRTHWAVTRKQFFSHGVNAASLRAIEEAAFFLCLDSEDYIPQLLQDEAALDHYARCMLHGNGADRWYDKSFNLIVGRNCVVGFNVEHSWADAPVMGHLWEVALTSKTNYDHDGHCRGRTNSSVPGCRRLPLEFSEQCIDAMKVSLTVATELLNDVDLHVLVYRYYGKSFISSQRLSPDAYFQMALQLAFFRNQGHFCLTYEASMTRLFREGRTETVRSCTNASVAFVNAMEDVNHTNEDRLSKLRTANQYHQTLYRDAMTGKGVDRHLFCLYVVSRHLGIDSPFLQHAVSQQWLLSTSQTPHGQTSQGRSLPQFSDFVSIGGGFGPVSDQGYGVSYILASGNTTFFHISSKLSCPYTNSKKFASHIVEALENMHTLFHS